VALGPIGWVSLALTALVSIFALIVASENEAEVALQQATAAAEELSTAADDAATEAEKIKDAFSGYDSAVTALNECTRGTQEWRDALANVN
jgi:hypothetical protein